MGEHNMKIPRRPETGWEAWQLTLGYISQHHSPDVLLKLQISPDTDGGLCWSSTLSWGQHEESIVCKPSLAVCLHDLWRQVDQFHIIFEDTTEASRSPTDYDDMDWLDIDTQAVLHRLIWMTTMSFKHEWSMVMVYEPKEDVTTRVRVRLMALDNLVQVGGAGSTLKNATRSLFRNAAVAFMKYAKNSDHLPSDSE